jgi:hypothetical protein
MTKDDIIAVLERKPVMRAEKARQQWLMDAIDLLLRIELKRYEENLMFQEEVPDQEPTEKEIT